MSADAVPTFDACERALLAFADALPLGVVAIAGARVQSINPTAARQFGLDARAAVDLPVQALFDDRAEAATLLAGPPVRECRLRLRRAGGDAFHAEIALQSVRSGARELSLLVVCDLSESDRIHAELARQREELQAIAHRLLSVQEDERRTLSRELHDDIGQQITAIKLGALALQGDDDARHRAEIVAEIVATADQTVVKLRNLSLLLRPPQLDALGLEAALRWQSDVLFRNGRLRLELALTPLPRRPAPEVELACFRIAQEALTNVLRHADARNVRLSLDAVGGRLRLEVADDGRGIAPDRGAGLGLVTMRERAQQLGGVLEIDSDPAHGTRVRAELPIGPAP